MLINITNTIKEKCNQSEVTLSEYVILNNTIIPVKAELNDNCYNDGNWIGTFILKELKFEAPNEYDFKEKEFEYYKKIGGESLKIGSFITTEIINNDSKEIVKVVAMDYGLKTQVEYKSQLNYSSGAITLLDVWNEACDLSGLVSGVNSFTNDNFIIDSDQFSGTGATIRDVFIGIGLSSCNFIKVMNDDKIYPMFTTQTNEVINEYTELDDKRDTLPINAVRLGMSDIEGNNAIMIDPSVTEGNEHWLVLNDNPFAYTIEKREQLITAIFNKINGFGYSAFTSKTSFKPYLTCGDLIKFKRKDGTVVDSIILRYEHDFDNITLEAPSVTKTTINYQRPETAITIAKRAEYKVDRNENKISMLVETAEDLNTKYTRLEQTDESLTTTIQSIITDGVSKVKNTLVTIDINGIKVATNLSKISTLMTNDTFAIQDDTGTYLAYFGYDEDLGQSVSEMDNLTITNYFIAGVHRVETYEEDGEERTGWFYVGGGN